MNKISINNMLGSLDGNLGEDDYSEPLEILAVSYTHLTLPTIYSV